MFCMNCGASLPNEAKFCFKCGQQVMLPSLTPTDNFGENSTKQNSVLASTSSLKNEIPIDEQINKVDSLNYFKRNPKEKEALKKMIFDDEKIISVGFASTKIDTETVSGALILTSKNAIFIRRAKFMKNITLRLNWNNGKNCKYNKGFFSCDVYIDGQKFNIDNATFSKMQSAFDGVKPKTPVSKNSMFNIMLHIDNADVRNNFKVNPKEKQALAELLEEDENIDIIVTAVTSDNVTGTLTFTEKKAVFISRSMFGKDATYIMEWPQEMHYITAFLSNELTIGIHKFFLDAKSFAKAEFAIKKYQNKKTF